MVSFFCPYLEHTVELTDERLEHICHVHPELSSIYESALYLTLNEPDQVRQSSRFKQAKLFTRWFDSILDGKYIVVVVVHSVEESERYWIITAYVARKLSGGKIEWQRS